MSSNGRRSIQCSEVKDHLITPAYPATDQSGILHFIHFPQPIISEEASKDELKDAFERISTRVCLAYALYMLYTKNLNRSSSRLRHMVRFQKQLLNYFVLGRTPKRRPGIYSMNVLVLLTASFTIRICSAHAENMISLHWKQLTSYVSVLADGSLLNQYLKSFAGIPRTGLMGSYNTGSETRVLQRTELRLVTSSALVHISTGMELVSSRHMLHIYPAYANYV